MIVSLIILAALVVVGGICYLAYRRNPDKQVNEPQQACCGMYITCEKDSLLSAVSETIEYYDDEELDRFKGREADDYTPEEIEEFRNVLLTLRPEEIAGWGRSIQLRGVTLPAEVREELLMIVGEARQQHNTTTDPEQ